MLRLGVILSGSGRTLENIFEHIEADKLDAEVAVVISNTSKAYGLVRAENHDVSSAVIRSKDFEDDQALSDAITAKLAEHEVDLVVLAGFLKKYLVPPEFHHKVVNIHPALIPAFCGTGFYGHHVHQAAIDYGVKVSGCTVHFADDEYDAGPVILQKTVPVYADDTAEALAERVFEAEKEALPEAIQLIAEGRVRIEGRVVHIASK